MAFHRTFIGILVRNTNIGIVAHNLPNWVFYCSLNGILSWR